MSNGSGKGKTEIDVVVNDFRAMTQYDLRVYRARAARLSSMGAAEAAGRYNDVVKALSAAAFK